MTTFECLQQTKYRVRKTAGISSYRALHRAGCSKASRTEPNRKINILLFSEITPGCVKGTHAVGKTYCRAYTERAVQKRARQGSRSDVRQEFSKPKDYQMPRAINEVSRSKDSRNFKLSRLHRAGCSKASETRLAQ